ncbi:MAG: DNA polymerase III subunit [Acidobacteria bacterium]|nr:DNA polymerase III subunit [Acidobacteriota bacterium]MCA1611369.1 DNA polymerase III subunit [Acidobacteriota bacterium]
MTTPALLERLAGGPQGSFPGALLLTGPSESRLEAEARRLAALLLCSEHPSDSCDSCRRAASGAHPDLFVAEAEGVQIRVERVRQALEFAAGRPYEGSRRVALVLGAERLGVEGGNALLKSLEEPGSHLHWILTAARPESLLSTIRSRCAVAIVPALTRAERTALWKSRGFEDDEAADLALFAPETEAAPAELLADYREFRERALLALDTALSGNRPAPLLMLAEDLGRAEPRYPALVAELLADAAVASSASAEHIRHRTAAGAVGALASRRSGEALSKAAVSAADSPPDSRRGNRRLHFEALLLDLLVGGLTPAAH